MGYQLKFAWWQPTSTIFDQVCISCKPWPGKILKVLECNCKTTETVFVYVCLCVCLAGDSSETVQVNIVKLKLDTVTASGMRMHHVLIILTLTFIQGHTDQNHENNNFDYFKKICKQWPSIVKRVWLSIYMTIGSTITLAFIQGHKCISNLTTFNLEYLRQYYFKLFIHSNFVWR